jgi:hypothetical protein
MPRVYLPLLPLPVLAALVAASACSKPRSDETTHVIPPPAPYVAPAAVTAPPAPALAAAPAASAANAAEDAPSAEDLKAFERAVPK